MKTKICNYCKEPIAAEATKCPKCQSFQSKFRSPSFVSLISALLMLLFLIPMFQLLPSNDYKYIDYKDKIDIKVLNIDTIKRQDNKRFDLLNILVELENKTDIIEKYGDFQLKLHPNSTAKSAIKIPIYEEYRHTAVKVKLINLRHNRY